MREKQVDNLFKEFHQENGLIALEHLRNYGSLVHFVWDLMPLFEIAAPVEGPVPNEQVKSLQDCHDTLNQLTGVHRDGSGLYTDGNDNSGLPPRFKIRAEPFLRNNHAGVSVDQLFLVNNGFTAAKDLKDKTITVAPNGDLGQITWVSPPYLDVVYRLEILGGTGRNTTQTWNLEVSGHYILEVFTSHRVYPQLFWTTYSDMPLAVYVTKCRCSRCGGMGLKEKRKILVPEEVTECEQGNFRCLPGCILPNTSQKLTVKTLSRLCMMSETETTKIVGPWSYQIAHKPAELYSEQQKISPKPTGIDFLLKNNFDEAERQHGDKDGVWSGLEGGKPALEMIFRGLENYKEHAWAILLGLFYATGGLWYSPATERQDSKIKPVFQTRNHGNYDNLNMFYFLQTLVQKIHPQYSVAMRETTPLATTGRRNVKISAFVVVAKSCQMDEELVKMFTGPFDFSQIDKECIIRMPMRVPKQYKDGDVKGRLFLLGYMRRNLWNMYDKQAVDLTYQDWQIGELSVLLHKLGLGLRGKFSNRTEKYETRPGRSIIHPEKIEDILRLYPRIKLDLGQRRQDEFETRKLRFRRQRIYKDGIKKEFTDAFAAYVRMVYPIGYKEVVAIHSDKYLLAMDNATRGPLVVLPPSNHAICPCMVYDGEDALEQRSKFHHATCLRSDLLQYEEESSGLLARRQDKFNRLYPNNAEEIEGLKVVPTATNVPV